jgi:hypothetical protein
MNPLKMMSCQNIFVHNQILTSVRQVVWPTLSKHLVPCIGNNYHYIILLLDLWVVSRDINFM